MFKQLQEDMTHSNITTVQDIKIGCDKAILKNSSIETMIEMAKITE